jgi:L-asparaginase
VRTGDELPRIAVFVLGGTISGAADGRGRSVPGLAAADLLEAVPGVRDLAAVEVGPTMAVGSHALTPADVCQLAHDISARVADGCDAIVITQGTDTLEETAYGLALQLDLPTPVVLTGAMRPPMTVGPDGAANLLAAFRVATTPSAAALGPVVVIHDEVHCARWVTKAHTSRAAAFASPGHGPVGSVIEGRVRLHGGAPEADYLGLPERVDPRVELVWTWLGAGGEMVEAAATAAGIVVAAMGGGHVPPAMVPACRQAVERGQPVVLASRCIAGPILTDSYGGPGTETELIEFGLIPAGSLSAVKARLRLQVALALGVAPRRAFPLG